MELSIIIPFLNEGKEVANTVESILSTIEGKVDIILINDCSTDSCDYKAIADKYSCVYVKNEERLGVAKSRDLGISMIKTEYFLLLDGHMRFYDKGWDKKLLKYLKLYPRSVICSQTKFLNKLKNGKIVDTTKITPCGSFIDFDKTEIFRCFWNNVDIMKHSNVVETPCILGAAYACNKTYWQRLHGLEGLINYGTDEELISIKTWLEGGRCLFIKDWVVGHIYRKQFPYSVLSEHTIYNRLYVLELFFPYKIKQKIFSLLKNHYSNSFDKAYISLKNNYKQIKKDKEYYNSIFKYSIDDFIARNTYVGELNYKLIKNE